MKTGVSKVAFDVYEKGLGMLGYGRDFNKFESKLDTIYARAFSFIDNAGNAFYFVNCELCFITPNLKKLIVETLQERFPNGDFHDKNIMITAQHTHSGPAGYSEHPLYNFPVPQFRPKILHKIADTIIEAIILSKQNLKEASISFEQGDLEPEIEVAYNRSLKAYNNNAEVEKLTHYETHLAIERKMDLLRIDDLEGNPMGQINFFGVHTTSLGYKENKMSGDNKGYAANYFEEDIGNNFVAAFAQQLTADVSPNFHGKGKNYKKGPYKTDLENCKFNGQLQYQKAKEIWKNAGKNNVSGNIDTEIRYHDFANVLCNPKFAKNNEQAWTSSACHGTAFFAGTPIDGPGMPEIIHKFARTVSRTIRKNELKKAQKSTDIEYKNWIERKYATQDPKTILFETGKGVVWGTSNIKNFAIPSFVDGGLKQMKKEHRLGALRETPWTPHFLPIQIAIVGNIAFIGFPGEITTVAGQQLRKLMQSKLASKGVQHVIIASYANCYMGYCVTNDEYQTQCYEGGHTVFGQWTHAAFMTKFEELAEVMDKAAEDRKNGYQFMIHKFSDKELALRTRKNA